MAVSVDNGVTGNRNEPEYMGKESTLLFQGAKSTVSVTTSRDRGKIKLGQHYRVTIEPEA